MAIVTSAHFVLPPAPPLFPEEKPWPVEGATHHAEVWETLSEAFVVIRLEPRAGTTEVLPGTNGILRGLGPGPARGTWEIKPGALGISAWLFVSYLVDILKH